MRRPYEQPPVKDNDNCLPTAQRLVFVDDASTSAIGLNAHGISATARDPI
jgi:hypothetical protein